MPVEEVGGGAETGFAPECPSETLPIPGCLGEL